jgi:hypothetical protein
MPEVNTAAKAVGLAGRKSSHVLRRLTMQLALGAGALAAFAPSAHPQAVEDPAAPAGAAGQVVPVPPPGISITPSTRPFLRPPSPPVSREPDAPPPVEGCPSGDKRKLELLV